MSKWLKVKFVFAAPDDVGRELLMTIKSMVQREEVKDFKLEAETLDG